MNKYDSLTPNILKILKHKDTEAPFSGRYIEKEKIDGTYLCRGCGQALFRADNQFTSHCGWPSFDDQIANAVYQTRDADGRREEIICANCHGHLGHVFLGEGHTPKNLRHCVNSLAIEFVEDKKILKTEEAILAAGCFWGVQYLLDELPGVLKTEVGYTGGHVEYPSYEQVCRHDTGHLEAIRVMYDPTILSYEQLLKYFFEIHNPSQADGQGPDRGPQYLSAVFYFDDQQKEIAEKVMAELIQLGIKPTTQLRSVTAFWPAEEYHQDYYQKNGHTPYCHVRVKRFLD